MTNDGRSLLVRNLRYETSPNRVRNVFEAFGQVRDVYLPLDHFNRKPRGFGFVEFYNERDAEVAQREMDGKSLDGGDITCIIAQDRRKSPETMKNLTMEQRRGGYGHRRRMSRSRSGGRGKSRSLSYRSRSRDHYTSRYSGGGGRGGGGGYRSVSPDYRYRRSYRDDNSHVGYANNRGSYSDRRYSYDQHSSSGRGMDHHRPPTGPGGGGSRSSGGGGGTMSSCGGRRSERSDWYKGGSDIPPQSSSSAAAMGCDGREPMHMGGRPPSPRPLSSRSHHVSHMHHNMSPPQQQSSPTHHQHQRYPDIRPNSPTDDRGAAPLSPLPPYHTREP